MQLVIEDHLGLVGAVLVHVNGVLALASEGVVGRHQAGVGNHGVGAGLEGPGLTGDFLAVLVLVDHRDVHGLDHHLRGRGQLHPQADEQPEFSQLLAVFAQGKEGDGLVLRQAVGGVGVISADSGAILDEEAPRVLGLQVMKLQGSLRLRLGLRAHMEPEGVFIARVADGLGLHHLGNAFRIEIVHFQDDGLLGRRGQGSQVAQHQEKRQQKGKCLPVHGCGLWFH